MSLLRSLDDTFAGFTESQPRERGTAPLSLSEPLLDGAFLRRNNTMLLQEGGSLVGEPSIRLLVQCIFEREDLLPFQESLLQEVLASGPALSHAGAVADQLQKILMKHLNSEHYDRESAVEALRQLYVHSRKTKASREAYAPSAYGNPNAVFWPNPVGDRNSRDLFEEIPFATTHKFIDRSTAIGSAGSCFAMEIAHRLQQERFNYVVTEPSLMPGHPADSCARWGTIFNTPSLHQLVKRSFLKMTMPPLAWCQERNGKMTFFDPFREDMVFDSVQELEESWNQHLIASRKALESVDVFVMTLGMNEVWRLKSNGIVFSRAPWKMAPELVEKSVMTVAENLQELQNMLDLWRTYNPGLKLILSVSPVPLHATFRAEEQHIISANAHSKATLRVVADEFVRRNRDVFYFPSYETVMYCTKDAWSQDQRHVSPQAVSKVMQLFDKIFVR